MSRLTPEQVIDVMEDVAIFMHQCRVYRDLGGDAGEYVTKVSELHDADVFDYRVVAEKRSPMECIRYLGRQWARTYGSEKVFNAEAVADNLWHFMREYCRTDNQKSADMLRELANNVESGGADIESLSINRGVKEVPDGGFVRSLPDGQHEITIKYREK